MKTYPDKALNVVGIIGIVTSLIIIVLFSCFLIDRAQKQGDYEKAVSMCPEKLDILKEYVLSHSDDFRDMSEIYIAVRKEKDNYLQMGYYELNEAGRQDLVDVLTGIDDMGIFVIYPGRSDSGVYYMDYSFRSRTRYHVIYVHLLYTGGNTAVDCGSEYGSWEQIADGFYVTSSVAQTYNLP